jgi:hypothetical protein
MASLCFDYMGRTTLGRRVEPWSRKTIVGLQIAPASIGALVASPNFRSPKSRNDLPDFLPSPSRKFGVALLAFVNNYSQQIDGYDKWGTYGEHAHVCCSKV